MSPLSRGRGARVLARLRENLPLKVLSLGLAILGWLLAHGEQTYQESIVVPVEYLQPDSLVLLNDSPLPERVVVQVAGSQAALQAVKSMLREGSVQYLVDLEEAEPGRTVHSFRLPPLGMSSLVTMQTVSPAEVEFEFDELSSRTLPVELRVRGELPSGYAEKERKIAPDLVTIMGARSELTGLRSVPTVPLRLGDMRESINQAVALDLSGMHMHPDSATSVQVELTIAEVTGDLLVADVPVLFAAETNAKVKPTLCEVRLFGPLTVLGELGPDSLRAEVTGKLDRELRAKLSEEGVRWDPLVTEGNQVRVLIQVVHPRASEVVVKEVIPALFQVAMPPSQSAPGGQRVGAD